MLKKHTTHTAEGEACSTGKGCCAGKCFCKILCCLGTVAALVFAILAFCFAHKNYALEILKAGGQENFDKMNNLYASADFVKYMTEQTDQSIQSFGDMLGNSDTTAPDTTNPDTTTAENTSKTISADQVATVLDGAIYYGDPEAKIVILEYSDFMCPYCQRHYTDQTIEKVVDANPNVALSFRNFPLSFHETSDLGSRGLYCVGKLWDTEAYYAYIADAMKAGSFSKDSVVTLWTKVGIAKDKMTECYDDTASAAAVNASITEWQTIFGVTGTPGNIILNRETGKFIEISGAYPKESFDSAVAQLLN